MKKIINEVRDYRDYRILLNDDFIARSSKNPSYSLRAYARDLHVSPGFLSDTLRGKKDLSRQNGRVLFSKLGFEGEDLDYVENLIVFSTTTDRFEKELALEYLDKKFNKTLNIDDSKDIVLKSVDHFMTHGVVDAFTKKSQIFSITDQLGISRERVMKIISELVENKYLIENGESYTLTNIDLGIRNHARILEVQSKFANRSVEVMQKRGGMSPPNSQAHMFTLPLNAETHKLVDETHKQYIKSMIRISTDSKENDRLVFWSETFLTLAPTE